MADGGLPAGWFGPTFGVRGAIATMAVVVLLGILLHIVSPLGGRRDLPVHVPPLRSGMMDP